jgi:membrane-associated protease RseP (regulator of RpoE activity)
MSTLTAVLLFAAAPLYAESYSTETRPYIGLELDGAHLPELLVKHLNLSADQGVRIANVLRDSPADKAGIERDDIIIVFQGKPVTYCRQVAEAVREAAVGAEVSFEVIHQGRRRTVTVKLEPFPGQFDWRYPPEPRMQHSWQPGKFFRLRPGDENWIQVPSCDTPGVDINILNLFDETYTYSWSKDGESYTITIEGNPWDDDTNVTVRVSKPEYETTVKNIDDLPKKYRASAKEALKNTQNSAQRKAVEYHLSRPPAPPQWPDQWQRFFKQAFPYHQPAPPVGLDQHTLKELQKQMRDLQQRLEELERQRKHAPAPAPDEPKQQDETADQKHRVLEEI